MIPIFRPPVHISREQKTSTFPNERLYSQHEVEDIIFQAIETLNCTELIRRNGIDIQCIHHCSERDVIVIIRQGNEICKILLKGGE